VEGCYEEQKIQAILQRNNIRAEDKQFIDLLISHRKYLNPHCTNAAIRSNYTRLILLQLITEKFNKQIDEREQN